MGGLVGRDATIQQLGRVVDDALAGRGRTVVLTGEAGIGKTALLVELAAYARDRGAQVAWGTCWPGEGTPAYWPWRQVLRDLALDEAAFTDVDPGDTEEPGSARFRLFDAVSSAVLAESRMTPVILLFDDMQWADAGSVLLLDFLDRRLAAGAIAVVAALRDVADPSSVQALTGRHLTIALTGIPPEAVRQIAADSLGPGRAADLAGEMHRRSGGNPFLVQQLSLLVAGRDDSVLSTGDLPVGVRQALEQRLAPLDPAPVVAAAAVLSRPASADLLERVAELPPADAQVELAKAVTQGVLTKSGQDYGFVHDLLREHAYRRLDPGTRAALHARAAALLRSEPDVVGAELAHHAVAADPTSALAFDLSARAARQATGQLAFEESVAHWNAAVVAAPDDQELLGVLLELGDAQRRAGDVEAMPTLRRAAALARGIDDPRGLARAALGMHALGSAAFAPREELVAALTEARTALRHGSDRADQQLDAAVSAALARVLSWSGQDTVGAGDLAGGAVTTARATGDAALLASCLLAQHHAIVMPGTATRRLAIVDEIIALAERTQDRDVLIEARLLRAGDLLEQGDPAFRSEIQAFIAAAESSGQPRWRYAALVRRATLALFASDLTKAEGLIDAAFRLGEECGEPGVRDVRGDHLWQLYSCQGRVADLADLADLAGVGTVSPSADEHRSPAPDAGLRGLILAERGERDEAARLGVTFADGCLERQPGYGWMTNLAIATELAAAVGDQATASRLYDALAPHADQCVVSGVAVSFIGAVHHHLGVLAALTGAVPRARAHLEAALATHERIGARAWAVRSRYELARLGVGDPLRVTAEARALGITAVLVETVGTFHREGVQWTLEFDGHTVRLRDLKGLHDLAVLLGSAGHPVAAADLMAGAGEPTARADLWLGADPVLDETARAAVKARLTDLAEEIEEARRWSDPERLAGAEAERDALLAELAAATGLGGRSRRLGDQGERARKAVSGRIRDAIGRIAEAHPSLGVHLRASVTTGSSCTYSPVTPVRWRL